MSSFKYVDGNKPMGVIYPFQDLLVSMTEALQNQEYTAYIDLVSHLRNMSILAFDTKDIESLEKIDELVIKVKKHIDVSLRKRVDSSQLYQVETVNSSYLKGVELKIFCEYRFSYVIERVCIYALRKTIFRDQIPEAQQTVYYKAARDIELTLERVNSVLVENEIKPYEVEL
ncbi:hypothetical protein MSKOL_1623 [Methanosarcina sp. Kolksee]|uniref:hypothetical protein n=1 Tax=Methanosarcina sp. Kolksee TaxID=1434099 RepID=UPI000615F62A|nr:hypothetical protein [Methanosarcina sp. Kolksee]AKB47400.1 hypothetical protein MSKOL_1623 [Methanosarcina sp. Kolksee]